MGPERETVHARRFLNGRFFMLEIFSGGKSLIDTCRGGVGVEDKVRFELVSKEVL